MFANFTFEAIIICHHCHHCHQHWFGSLHSYWDLKIFYIDGFVLTFWLH